MLFDHGSHTVLISDDWVDRLKLRHHKLPVPELVSLAMKTKEQKKECIELYDYVKLHLCDPSNFWTAHMVRAIIAPRLCAPVILGLPFLAHNNIVIDHAVRTAVNKCTGFDLLHPVLVKPTSHIKPTLKEIFSTLQ